MALITVRISELNDIEYYEITYSGPENYSGPGANNESGTIVAPAGLTVIELQNQPDEIEDPGIYKVNVYVN